MARGRIRRRLEAALLTASLLASGMAVPTAVNTFAAEATSEVSEETEKTREVAFKAFRNTLAELREQRASAEVYQRAANSFSAARTNENYIGEYTLYDMSGDGVPEMLILLDISQGTFMEYAVYVFSVRKSGENYQYFKGMSGFLANSLSAPDDGNGIFSIQLDGGYKDIYEYAVRVTMDDGSVHVGDSYEYKDVSVIGEEHESTIPGTYLTTYDILADDLTEEIYAEALSLSPWTGSSAGENENSGPVTDTASTGTSDTENAGAGAEGTADASVYAGLLRRLQNNESGIRSLESYLGSHGNYGVTKQVAVADVTGDGVPELLFCKILHEGAAVSLSICNDQEDGELYYEELPLDVGGSCYYALFRTEDGALHLIQDVGDESKRVTWRTLTVLEGGKLGVTEELVDITDYTQGQVRTCTYGGSEISAEECDDLTEAWYTLMDAVLLCGRDTPYAEEISRAANEEYAVWMSYDEAAAFLRNAAGDAAADVPEQTSAEGLTFPDSDSRLLTDADIAGMDYQAVRYAVNEIYARHGYLFHNEEVLAMFRDYSWYNGTNADMDAVYSEMNDIEKKNVEFLASAMDRLQ